MAQQAFRDAKEPPYMEFVGDLEAKYKAESDPWDQSGAIGPRAEYYEFSRKKLYARMHNRIPSGALGLEIGCGYGYLTTMLGKCWKMTGVDVSETALKRAAKLNPGFDYVHADVMSPNFRTNVMGKFHFVLFAQCLWYIMHDLPSALDNVYECLVDDGYFIVSQAFLKDQNYGREIIDGFEGAVEYFMNEPNLRLLEASQDDTGKLAYYDGLLIFRKLGDSTSELMVESDGDSGC